MGSAILLTGAPGSGKTTAIMHVLDRLERSRGGFYTQEIREGGRRTGFRLITLDGRQGTMAHVRIGGRPRVGRYGVDLAVVEGLGAESIERAIAARHLVVIDEIGPMELFSQRFRAAVIQALESESQILGSIVRRSIPFADAIKARAGVELIEIVRSNREEIVARVLEMMCSSS
ncbi:MAG: NTPase [Anaerolineales bacterium]|jgi:nucleoside-triphosphatase